eukprot:TRINITY_DN791_c1_g1_i1.p1 TRINITY_DN791_c1_g1~~TRINITY_DN791_c1_g1_i1.p1  ORF type:complete len:331 (+),score=86.45 TRINITY_DN791_c1_g1_i1:82-993(+)
MAMDDAERVPLMHPEEGAAEARGRRAPLGAVALVLGLVVVASLALSSNPGPAAVTLNRQAPDWVAGWYKNFDDAWNSGDADGVAAHLLPNFVFIYDVKDGILGKQDFVNLNKAGQITGARGALHSVVQQGDVMHVRINLAADQPAIAQWYWRLERHGGKWLGAAAVSGWGKNTRAVMPESAPAAPQWLIDNCNLYDRIWARVPGSVYAKAAWFQDAIVYDRLADDGFLTRADLVPALDQYARLPGFGAGQVHFQPLYLRPDGDSVMHIIGANTRMPDVGPWYARMEKRNGVWKIAAEVVTVGV